MKTNVKQSHELNKSIAARQKLIELHMSRAAEIQELINKL